MDGMFREILPDGIEPHESVVSLLLELEAHGWYPRKFITPKGIRYWPDGERGRLITIDLYFPVNEDKVAWYREHTHIDLVTSKQEELEG